MSLATLIRSTRSGAAFLSLIAGLACDFAPRCDAAEPAYDCVTEMWFTDPVALSETMAWMRSPASQALHDDEALFMDRSSMAAFFVEEAEPAPAGSAA